MSYPMTKDGYTKLSTELKDLKNNRRPAVIEAIAVAREHGDLKENAEYHAAREEQGYIESRISELDAIVSRANIVDVSKIVSDCIVFGAKVIIINEDTDEKSEYQLVGQFESDLDKGMISYECPIGKALLGREKGDSIEVFAPGGTKYYEILKITYGK